LRLLRHTSAGAAAALFGDQKLSNKSLDAMWLPAATKQRAREAIPRSEEPVVTITRRKDGRWKVYVRNPDGIRSKCEEYTVGNIGTSQLLGLML
jgi:hypothetical protein